jgi:hypothetical protein
MLGDRLKSKKRSPEQFGEKAWAKPTRAWTHPFTEHPFFCPCLFNFFSKNLCVDTTPVVTCTTFNIQRSTASQYFTPRPPPPSVPVTLVTPSPQPPAPSSTPWQSGPWPTTTTTTSHPHAPPACNVVGRRWRWRRRRCPRTRGAHFRRCRRSGRRAGGRRGPVVVVCGLCVERGWPKGSMESEEDSCRDHPLLSLWCVPAADTARRAR